MVHPPMVVKSLFSAVLAELRELGEDLSCSG